MLSEVDTFKFFLSSSKYSVDIFNQSSSLISVTSLLAHLKHSVQRTTLLRFSTKRSLWIILHISKALIQSQNLISLVFTHMTNYNLYQRCVTLKRTHLGCFHILETSNVFNLQLFVVAIIYSCVKGTFANNPVSFGMFLNLHHLLSFQ